MEIINQIQKQSILLFLKNRIFAIILLLLFSGEISAQCLSSVNPVGGANNMLVLEKRSIRAIALYKYGGGSQYFQGSSHYDLKVSIDKAFYNYLATTIGYGVSNKFTLELETGYFFNKTQIYNTESADNRLTGRGLSNLVILGKHSLFTEPFKRIYVTGAIGAKIPYSLDYQWENGVLLPPEIQPTMGAMGVVFNLNFVKENPENGMRYFFISRAEVNSENKNEYKLGHSFYNSFYLSKHLMFPWLKGDWTTILQVRNEIRTFDKMYNIKKESSGSTLLFLAPQINYVHKDEWYLSAMLDIPVYQKFNGIQLGAGPGITFILSRTFRL